MIPGNFSPAIVAGNHHKYIVKSEGWLGHVVEYRRSTIEINTVLTDIESNYSITEHGKGVGGKPQRKLAHTHTYTLTHTEKNKETWLDPRFLSQKDKD